MISELPVITPEEQKVLDEILNRRYAENETYIKSENLSNHLKTNSSQVILLLTSLRDKNIISFIIDRYGNYRINILLTQEQKKEAKINKVEQSIDNVVLQRTCKDCGETKNLTKDFHKKGLNFDGSVKYRTECRKCYNKKYNYKRIENSNETKSTKVCFRCKVEKDVKEFNKNSSTKDGLQSWCNECRRVYNFNRNQEKYRIPVEKTFKEKIIKSLLFWRKK